VFRREICSAIEMRLGIQTGFIVIIGLELSMQLCFYSQNQKTIWHTNLT